MKHGKVLTSMIVLHCSQEVKQPLYTVARPCKKQNNTVKLLNKSPDLLKQQTKAKILSILHVHVLFISELIFF